MRQALSALASRGRSRWRMDIYQRAIFETNRTAEELHGAR